MEAVTPFKEAIDMIRDAGGAAFRLCFQCGLCTASCPWNHVRTFMPHKMITQSKFGLVELGEEDWWICSTCNMCVSRCPRGVAITDIIRSVRNITLEFDYRAAPESLRSAMGSLKGAGNPWSGDRDKRADWARDLDIPAFGEGTELLYFSCCVPAYDPKMENVARATTRILKKTGARFGILGSRESCCGESVRKAGNNELFETLAKSNIQAFQEAGVKEVVLTSPHCYVTFKDEYPALGGEFKVVHFTQYLAGLIDQGRLAFQRSYPKRVVYHDPCYLGRHSGIYDEPRKVLESIPGLTLLDEMNARENSLCCGGGGGRIWMETKKEERFSDILVEQAVELGAEVLATACPYCILNFKDSVLTRDKADVLEIKDISEIVDEVI
ncbi:MAG: (Fe-S)-binding protein [Deltaproteobacteria bacterium]|nr:(Fe-S)-binding protein [Deltaproteobacteria bacterium]